MSNLQKRLTQAGGHEQVTATAALAKMNERARPIRLNEITLDLGLQFRLDVKGKDGIDEKHVLDLMHVIADGADTDPVILYRVDKALLMVDGFHRYEAYRRSERKTIPAIVRDGTYPEAEEAAENANLQFKKALGDESKKYIFARRVQRGYQTNGISWNNLSDKAIAAELGVSYDTISRWFEELESGVRFLTPAGQEISIQIQSDRSVVYGRDGKEYQVQAIREANSKRAAEAAERRAAEEAERKRTLPAIEKLRVICDMLISKYGPRYAEKGQPFFDDPNKGFKWCQQVSNPTFVTGTDWEIQFLKEYHAKSVGLYQEFLRLVDQATFIEAEMDSWTDDQLADWVYAMRQQPRAGYGMAQPKNVGATFEQSKPIGRHHTGATPTVTATELAVEEHTEPSGPCPFRIGQNVQVIETSEHGIVQATEYVNHEWVIRVEMYNGLKTFKAHEIERPFREQVDEALSVPSMGTVATTMLDEAHPDDEREVDTNPAPCPYQPGNVVKYRPTDGKCELLDAKWDGHVWWLLVRDENGQDWDAPLDQFERVGVLLDSHAPPPAVDGASAFDDPTPPSQPSKSNGKRQAEMMVEDMRTLYPRLVMDTINATVDYRMGPLVRWESPKDIQTILDHADDKELKLLLRENERLLTEWAAALKGIQRGMSHLQNTVRQIQEARQRA